MALQSSGPIAIGDIAGEFGGSTPHDLSEYYGVAAGVPSSGQIALSDFYGTQANFLDTTVTSGWNSLIDQGYDSGMGSIANATLSNGETVTRISQDDDAVQAPQTIRLAIEGAISPKDYWTRIYVNGLWLNRVDATNSGATFWQWSNQPWRTIPTSGSWAFIIE